MVLLLPLEQQEQQHCPLIADTVIDYQQQERILQQEFPLTDSVTELREEALQGHQASSLSQGQQLDLH